MGIGRREAVAGLITALSGCIGVPARGVWEDRPGSSGGSNGTRTATPTRTPTETPTATPEPDDVVVGLGKWGRMETDGTELGFRVTHYDTAEKISRGRGQNPISGDDDETFLVANVEIRNIRTPTTVGGPSGR